MTEEKKKGCIYILTNLSFPEYVKIGYADDIEKRLKDLNRSECIPFAFRKVATYDVDERLQDLTLHRMIDNINPNLRTIDTFAGKKRKKEFYAMSADDAYNILKTIATLSGTSDRLHKFAQEGYEITDEQIARNVENNISYTEEQLLEKGDGNTVMLYEKLKNKILKLGNVKVDPKKLYIAFKSPKNFTDVEIQKYNLKVYINLKKGELNDPEDRAEDVSGIGCWGNGDYRMYISDVQQIDYAMQLIKQSYDANKI